MTSHPIAIQEAQEDINFLLELNSKLVNTLAGDDNEPAYSWHACKSDNKIARFELYYGAGVLDNNLYGGSPLEHEDVNKYLSYLCRQLGLAVPMALFLSKIIKISFGISNHVIGGEGVTGGYPIIKVGSAAHGDIHIAIAMPGLFIIIEGTVQCGYSH